jgi:hypothetical protein
VLVYRPFAARAVTALFGLSIWVAALFPLAAPIARFLALDAPTGAGAMLQQSATLATLALLLRESRKFGVLAIVGQVALFCLAQYLWESDYELCFAHLAWYGALLGVHALRKRTLAPTLEKRSLHRFLKQDALIFTLTVPLALLVNAIIFNWVVFNGDEVANSFQADVYAHFRAFAKVPPCPSMFENYWVFRYEGRAFAQYTPGWPLFMAPFQRLGLIVLAGPVMAGILAVGVARLSRRAAVGVGATVESSERIVAIAGPLGAALLMMGPAVLLNGASRFSHTMVCACFAWALESLCVVTSPSCTRATMWRYGLLLGAATSLCVATRPADGALLGIGVFLYFVWALFSGKIAWRTFVGTCIAFAFFAGITLLILRLQMGRWFQTAYSISHLYHPEAALRVSLPSPNQWKFGIPLATGSYCWWPVAPALGIAGLIQAFGGAERRVSLMLIASAIPLLAFYSLVEFGRGVDDGLGPRYVLPIVVPMAVGGAAILAPLFNRAFEVIRERQLPLMARLRFVVPALTVVAAVVFGVSQIVPLTYPVAHAEHKYSTSPLRAARKLGLKNAVVMLEPGQIPAHHTNLAQNPPMDPNPDVLFLIRRSAADDACVQKHFPGRKWYRATRKEELLPF